jgi:DNA-binding MarR family transcriptional regulator
MLVNALERDGLVEVVPNPSHRRSSLIRLTRCGRTSIDSMARREQRVFDRIGRGMSDNRLQAATSVLRHIRRSLEGRAEAGRTPRTGARG